MFFIFNFQVRSESFVRFVSVQVLYSCIYRFICGRIWNCFSSRSYWRTKRDILCQKCSRWVSRSHVVTTIHCTALWALRRFLLNPGPTTACRKSMSHSQPLFVAGRHISTLLRTHIQEITSHILAWLFSSCSRTFRSWNRLNSKHFLFIINMQQSYSCNKRIFFIKDW